MAEIDPNKPSKGVDRDYIVPESRNLEVSERMG